MNYYNEIAEGYEELHKEEQEKKIAIIKKYLKPKANETLLDVGCGSGLTTRCWKCKRFGIDPSEKLLEKAKANDKNGNYILASAEKMPFPDRYFDIVVSITAIQNFDDIEKGLEEIKRAGKGKFVLTFLKKSPKSKYINSTIQKLFNIKEIIEGEKDLIFLAV
jgi:ubiquinone/menaquinone biosynthesis C-methylase UbiE